MAEWFHQLQQMLTVEPKLVLISVASVHGSTPREAGAKMLVSSNATSNTIGGGKLEYRAIQIARNMLADDQPNDVQRFSLGAGLGQCCGGVVTLFFEVVHQHSDWLQQVRQLLSSHQPFVQVIPLSGNPDFARLMVTDDSVIADVPDSAMNGSIIKVAKTMLEEPAAASIKRIGDYDFVFDPIMITDFTVYIFGAGHVGAAMVKQLEEQPCIVNWIDTRDDQLPGVTANNVTAITTDVPEAIIDEAAAGSYFLVMTHDHSLDQKLSELILKKDDYHYFGLIGSATKRKKFEHRLLDRGINARQLAGMTCPIGISDINSKRPAAIALAVTAELIQSYERVTSSQQRPVDHAENRESLHS